MGESLGITRFLVLCEARSGSTALCEILDQNKRIFMERELLNSDYDEEVKKYESVTDYLRDKLKSTTATEGKKLCAVGFKVFPQQLQNHGLTLAQLCSELDIRKIIVLWREDSLQRAISLAVAMETENWYQSKGDQTPKDVGNETKLKLDINDLLATMESQKQQWQNAFKNWPFGITPSFITYEELFPNYLHVVESKIYSLLRLKAEGWEQPLSVKQSDLLSYEDKIENLTEILEKCSNTKLNLEEMFANVLDEVFSLRGDVYKLLPDKEPEMNESLNNGKWLVRVGSPFLPDEAKNKVNEALDTGMVSSAAPYVSELSEILKKMYSCEVAQPCCNGFSALVLALQVANVGKGDEVIVPAFTMVAVGNAVRFVGAEPIFVDNDPINKYNPGWKEIQTASSNKVKAVIVSHTYGVPVTNLKEIKSKCEEKGWKLIEDISEVVGISFNDDPKKLLGTVGDFATASMYANKIVHAADGGFVIAKRDDGVVGRRLKSLVNHGFTENFHFVHFENAINGKINGLGAALACGTIPKVGEVIQHHASIAATYRNGLKRIENVTNELKTMPRCGYYDSPWVFGVECNSKEERRQLRKFLADHGIETRDFFFALHLQPAFKRDETPRLPIAEGLASTGFYLPNHTNVTEEHASYIANLIDYFFLHYPYIYEMEVNNFLGANTEEKPQKNFLEEIVQLQVSEIITRFGWYLQSESWSDRKYILDAIEEIKQHVSKATIKDVAHADKLNEISAYLGSQTNEWLPTDIPNPWLQIDVVNAEQFKQSNSIPTNTTVEMRQMVSWAVQKYKPRNVLEVGVLFGHTVQLICESSSSVEKVTAVDPFLKYKWFNNFFPDVDMTNKDLLATVEGYLSKDCLQKTRLIQAILGDETLNASDQEWMSAQKFDFVFLDFSQFSEHLETVWKIIESNLIPDKTIVFINSLKFHAIKFLTDKNNVLKPIAKPGVKAKLFLYSPSWNETNEIIITTNEHQHATYETPVGNVAVDSENESEGENKALLPRQLDMSYDPEWNHHHQNAFAVAIDRVKELLHRDNAPVKFIAATEQYMCDTDEILQTPWVGMIHNTIHLPGLFYAPDLERLCTPKYAPWFKSCKGLFTLTTVQKEYLQQHLLPTLEVKFPIRTLKYPFIEPKTFNGPSPFIDEAYISTLNNKLDVVMVGAFQRDFEYFYSVEMPEFCQKALLISEDDMKKESKNCNDNNIKILPRANSEEYEALLRNSIIFLSLKQDGAANTLILEAIARNIPIIAPNLQSVTEYIGKDYSLLYDLGQQSLVDLIQPDNLKAGIEYLATKMDKSLLTVDHFVESFVNSTIVRYVPAFVIDKGFDVTVSIISYRRTHHLEKILESLWENQTFAGRIQIIVWNNNTDRAATINEYCNWYLRRNSHQRNLELIHSTTNHFAAIRLSLPPLVKSDRILICDDDIIPGPDFIQFFMDNHSKHPEDILCVRGHYFLPHELPEENPELTWKYYEHVRFADDSSPERLIHFVHSDVCLMPRKSLMEIASEPMPDKDFDLVDDYWTSFIANSKYGRNLRKLSTKGNNNLFYRTDDSDTKGIAMHKRSDVFDARIRHYIHHMTQNWPKLIDTKSSLISISDHVKEEKGRKLKEFLDTGHVGFNISSDITTDDVNVLKSWNVKYVRVGAVGSSGRKLDFEFSKLISINEESEQYLNDMLEKMKDFDVIITLDRRLASPEHWMFIANICNKKSNVIAYDLINEPATKSDHEVHYLDASNEGVNEVLEYYKRIIHYIRQVDDTTAIVIEPTFFGQAYSLDFMTTNNFLEDADPEKKLVMSSHFYEPSTLTTFKQDLEFPGKIDTYPNSQDLTKSTYWDEVKVKKRIDYLRHWSNTHNIPLFIGESGIGREVIGAEKYLKAVMQSCRENKLSCLLYAFRDHDWERMDYEYGLQKASDPLERNPENSIMKLIRNFISSCNNIGTI